MISTCRSEELAPTGSIGTQSPNRFLRWLYAAAGLCLLGFAAVANCTEYIITRKGSLLVRLPRLLGRLSGSVPVWWVIAGLPVVLFAIGLTFPAFRTAVLAPWRRTGPGRWKKPLGLSAVFVLFALSMAPRIPSWEDYAGMMLYLVLAGSGFALFLAGAYRRLRFLDVPMERLERVILGLDRRLFALLLFCFTLLAANAISWFVFGHFARISDSAAQLFQARIFASGRLFLPSPAFPAFFDHMNVINNGQWYSQYPFLHSLLMTPFVLLGIPWLTNPLLGALTVPLIYLLARDLFGERTGRMAGLLACLSPFILNMSGEFMNHATALLLCTLFLLFFFRTLRADRWYHPVVAGIAIGLMAGVRPFTGLMFAGSFAVYGLYRTAREPRRYFSRFLLMAGSAAAAAGLVFIYNWLTNGDPLLWGYVVNWGPGHEVGFGPRGPRFHTPWRGLVNSVAALNLVNKHLFEWPIPSLLPVAVLFASGTRDRRDWLLLTGFAGLVAAVFTFSYHDGIFGPRFLYESAACLVILTVRGAARLGPFLRGTCGLRTADHTAGRFTRRALPLLTLLMLGVGLWPLYRTYRGYGRVSPELVRKVNRAGLTNALVFCRHIGDGFNANSLALDGDVVYAQDLGILNPALTIAYPGREYYHGSPDALRPIDDVAWPDSRLKRTLDEMAAWLDSTENDGYRTIVWPFAEIPAPAPGPGSRLIDLRGMSQEISTGRHELDDYLPALVCWVVGNDQVLGTGRAWRSSAFGPMNALQDASADGYRFTLLVRTSEGTGAVYELTHDASSRP